MAFAKFEGNRLRIDGEIAVNHAILVNLTASRPSVLVRLSLRSTKIKIPGSIDILLEGAGSLHDTVPVIRPYADTGYLINQTKFQNQTHQYSSTFSAILLAYNSSSFFVVLGEDEKKYDLRKISHKYF